MRRGRAAVGLKTGGAWHCAAIVRAEEVKPCRSTDAGKTAKTTAEWNSSVPAEAGTNGGCNSGMVLQQSMPR
jgi:hypothetical protein